MVYVCSRLLYRLALSALPCLTTRQSRVFLALRYSFVFPYPCVIPPQVLRPATICFIPRFRALLFLRSYRYIALLFRSRPFPAVLEALARRLYRLLRGVLAVLCLLYRL